MGLNIDGALKEIKEIDLAASTLEKKIKSTQDKLSFSALEEAFEKEVRTIKNKLDVDKILDDLIRPKEVLCNPPTDILDRLKDILGDAAYNTLTKCNEKSVLESILGQSKVGRVLLKINDEFNLIDKKDISTLDNIMSTVKSIKNGPLLLIAAGLLHASHGSTKGDRSGETATDYQIEKRDEEAENALMEDVLEQSMRIGAVGVLAALDQKFKTEEQKLEVYLRAFSYAADYSRMEIINKILDYTGIPAIKARYPNAVRRILIGYKFPEKIGDNESPSNADYHEQLETLLDRIDPNWSKLKIGDRLVSNLGMFQKLSDDARDLFLIGEKYDQAAILATEHHVEFLSTVVRHRHGGVTLV